ncbi:hypothetical protein [Pseudooctadecabacter jejudonensis]|uniref:Uncharacterized protein n=1 Tax=Pseudooctadecabacter jejudonensis TaxID=1391910 RepID=A0A1Y5S2M8_9RHOB|nr:hypothetical protein [Pseudooctadecabacter jejudonensis]SLN30913.1 hypothetical protein PSJ8397_01413 [Pseudooctadecabacter jejudonensis]
MTGIRLALIAMSGVVATQATALSCLAPDIADTYRAVEAAPEAYVVVKGIFDFPTPPSSATDDINAPLIIRYEASFDGIALTRNGFTAPTNLDVVVTHDCAAAWCGSLVADIDTIAFLERTATGYAITVGPCGGQAFHAPDAAMIRTVEACATGACR